MHFTREYAIEGAALTNHSMVPHPLSARAIGKGNRSCVEFRVGVVGPDGRAAVESPSSFAEGVDAALNGELDPPRLAPPTS